MQKNGIIYLIDRDGYAIRVESYKSPSDRKRIINGWEGIYSKAILNCSIQIFPITDTSAIDNSGRNIMNPKNKSADKEYKPKPIVKPKAVYDNIKIYSYD